MKSPILPVSFPAAIRDEVIKLAMKKNISVSEFIRTAVFEKLSRETGKTYESLQWGGYRPNSGRKPAQAALKEGISASEYVRKALAEKLTQKTGKEYRALQRDGARVSSRITPSRQRLRTAAIAEKLNIPSKKTLSQRAG